MMSVRAALAASRQGFAFDALGEIGCLLCVVSIESALCFVSHLLRRGAALFNKCQVFISLEHRDSVREFTTVLRQWSNTRVPGELHFGTFLLDEHVGQRNQPAMMLFRDVLCPVLKIKSRTALLHIVFLSF